VVETDWKISKSSPHCHGCTVPFQLGQAYNSILIQTNEGLQRQDYCEDCFQKNRPEGVYYFWKRTLIAEADSAKRKGPVIDMDHVIEFFRRLEGETTPQKIAFRYILALMLARKKILLSEQRKRDAAGNEVQVFREKQGGQLHEVIEPALQPEEIEAVSNELGVLLGLQAPAAPATEPAAVVSGGPEVNSTTETQAVRRNEE